MEEVLAVLNDKAVIGYLATVDQGKPRVRPWGFMFENNGKLYFCTASTKDVYQQLLVVPYIEYSKTTQNMVWVRINGAIQFDEDLNLREKCFEVSPMLKNIYQTPENPIFKVFHLEHGRAVIDDFSPNPPRVFEF